MLQQVSIYDGKFSIGKLEFQLYSQEGTKASFDYRGEAGVANNHLRIVQGCAVYDYQIADRPTPESVDFSNGFEKALSQKRRRLPGEYTSHWYWGWVAGWESKENKR